MWNDFKRFLARGSVLDMAVGIVVGTAFGAIARSLVDNVLMPPIGLLLRGADFSDLFVTLQSGSPAGPYATLAEAQSAGAVVIGYGTFINTVVSFLIVAGAMFLVVTWVGRLSEKEEVAEPPAPTEKTCPYCASAIPIQAVRCPRCTSELEEAGSETEPAS